MQINSIHKTVSKYDLSDAVGHMTLYTFILYRINTFSLRYILMLGQDTLVSLFENVTEHSFLLDANN